MNSKHPLLKRLRTAWTLARRKLAARRRPKPPQRAVQLDFGWWPRQ